MKTPRHVLSLAASLAGLLGPIGLAPKPQPAAPTVAAPIVASPTGPIKGTMLLLHGGGWKGPDSYAQGLLMDQPGAMLVQHGWRVVSIDYRAGTDGLQDVMAAVSDQLAHPAGGLLCLYGESAGAHLALVAASRMKGIDCIAAAGPPIDFQAYMAEATAGGQAKPLEVVAQMQKVFGATPADTAPWEPVHIADKISADILIMRQTDDRLIPIDQMNRFLKVRPTAQFVSLQSGDSSNTDDWWLHGTLSDAGRAELLQSVGDFADREVADYRTARQAARTGCNGANRRYVPGADAALRSALRCLARRDLSAARAAGNKAFASSTQARLQGEITPARVKAALRSTAPGSRALVAIAAGKAHVVIRRGAVSKITVRRGR